MISTSGLFVWQGSTGTLVEALNNESLAPRFIPTQPLLYVYHTHTRMIHLCSEEPIVGQSVHDALGIRGESTIEIADNGQWGYTGGWMRGERIPVTSGSLQQIPKVDTLFNEHLLAPRYPIPQWEENLPDTTPTVNLKQNDYETLALLHAVSADRAYRFLAHCLGKYGGTAKAGDLSVGARIRLVKVDK